jgi:uncharacterized heparinase superfamily protein
MATLLNYWHTLRYLKLVQVFGRLWFKFLRPRIDLKPTPPIRQDSNTWIEPICRTSSMLAPDEFCFLNEIHKLIPGDWDNPQLEKLWRYNLHYFDYLNAGDSQECTNWHRVLLHQWIRENPATLGTGWEPYPTSLRIVNWIKWALNGNSLSQECLSSLAVQIRWLSRRLEYHILGNHLFSNAKALVYGGAFFSGPEADRWLTCGMKILTREIPEQILSDGGHFERSTMYHALALEDMLDLVNLSRCHPAPFLSWREFVRSWEEVVTRMGKWLLLMLHPDGEISFFNDATMGIAAPPADILAYGRRLGIYVKRPEQGSLYILKESGYFRVESNDGVFLIDIAPVGPDYLPGHAHADSLCFEGSVFGRRVFVNSGTSCYGGSLERLRQRATPAHNTVVIDSQNSSEVWGSFRVARRAYPRLHEIIDDRDRLEIDASHDGYQRLSGHNIHHRKWTFTTGRMVVTDRIDGRFSRAEARLHIHPDIRVDTRNLDRGQIELTLPQKEKIELFVRGGKVRMESTSWHPGFGISIPNQCLVVTFTQAEMTISIDWRQTA